MIWLLVRLGKTRVTAGAIGFAYEGVDDIRALCPNLSEEQIDITEFSTYTTDQFCEDMFQVTRLRTYAALCEKLVLRWNLTIHWLRERLMVRCSAVSPAMPAAPSAIERHRLVTVHRYFILSG